MPVEYTRRERTALKRDLLHGLRGKRRRTQEWWLDCLQRAGLSLTTQWARIDPREIADLRERLEHDDPELLDVFEEAYRAGAAELAARCKRAAV